MSELRATGWVLSDVRSYLATIVSCLVDEVELEGYVLAFGAATGTATTNDTDQRPERPPRSGRDDTRASTVVLELPLELEAADHSCRSLPARSFSEPS